MPKCVKCNKFFPPNYTEVISNHMPDNEGNYPQHCVFCRDNVEYVERESSPNSGKYVPYTKNQCIRDYKNFLGKLKNSRSIKDMRDAADNM